jgi:hypothetical protein
MSHSQVAFFIESQILAQMLPRFTQATSQRREGGQPDIGEMAEAGIPGGALSKRHEMLLCRLVVAGRARHLRQVHVDADRHLLSLSLQPGHRSQQRRPGLVVLTEIDPRARQVRLVSLVIAGRTGEQGVLFDRLEERHFGSRELAQPHVFYAQHVQHDDRTEHGAVQAHSQNPLVGLDRLLSLLRDVGEVEPLDEVSLAIV